MRKFLCDKNRSTPRQQAYVEQILFFSFPYAVLSSIRALCEQAFFSGIFCFIVALGFAVSPNVHAATDIQYVYDPAGRLIQAIQPDNTSAVYQYDAVGNILSVQQLAADDLAIIRFTPTSGSIGTSVTIYGSGFIPTLEGNLVKFNGVDAVLLGAGATEIEAIVPASASTGPISISNINGTVTSADSFVVGSFLESGIISAPISLSRNESKSFTFSGEHGQGYMLGFTDVIVGSGGSARVTVNTPNNANLVTCGTINKTASCAIPYLPETGIYTVTVTAQNTSISLSVVLNPDIGGALTTNVPETFVANKIGQAGTYFFEATAGMLGRLYITKDTIPGNTTVQLYRPDGVLHQSKTVGSSAGNEGSTTLDFINLPVDGTYRVRLIPPSGNATGTMQIILVEDITGISITEGATQTVSLHETQIAHFSFEGMAGQWLGVGFEDLEVAPSNGSLNVTIFKPDGSQLGSFVARSPASGYALPKLPVTGNYRIQIAPGSNTATFKLLLTEDESVSLESNGAAQTFNSNRIGQSAVYRFNGIAGQNINILIGDNTFFGNTYFYIYKPDGEQLEYTTINYYSGAGTSKIWTIVGLPSTGQYEVRLVPPSGKLGAISVALRSEDTGLLNISGTGEEVSLLAGQNAAYTFEGTEGQWLGIGLDDLETTPSNGYLTVKILKPDGSQLGSFSARSPAAGYAMPRLPASGIYKVQIEPGSYAASFELLLSEDIYGVLEANGAGQTFDSPRVGQSATYRFQGVSGQNISFLIDGN